MTEGGLATWKVSEGSAFSAGDVLLEIETDKATMDVEAQDDGVLAKILVQAGEKGVQVGKTIAILAEEGDDLSKAESEVKPDEEKPAQASSSSSSSSSKPAPQKEGHSSHTPAATQPSGSTGHDSGSSTSQMFPSVSRLLAENNISSQQASQIKGSGIRGMLTKGDVLVHLGQASSPTGSYQRGHGGVTAFGGAPPAGKGPAPVQGSQEQKQSNAAPSQPKVRHALDQSASASLQCTYVYPPLSQSLSAVELRSAIISGLAATSTASRSTRTSTPTDVIADVTASVSSVTSAKLAPKKDWLDGIL